MPAGVSALTSCRHGGTSAPPWATLNLANRVGDDDASVVENRRLLREQAQLPAEPMWLNQQHTARVTVVADAADLAADTSQIASDACVCDLAEQVCVVLTADCLPILVCSADGSQIAAIHAGWRGLAAGIIANTLAGFNPGESPPSAWIGPAISARHYVIDEPLYQRFIQLDAAYHAYFEKTDHSGADTQYHMDLAAIATLQLNRAGVDQVFHSGLCNYADNHFFSYRRDGITGRMATMIWKSA
ncbi:MAG: peptidoglycan editing factor PgeF [Gammaproteobacteria bacterium]